ncbi:MAG: hypothetical protein IKU37_05780 [Candidatus Gastranaerophilales bacterium]|nr:hypothetical protein [Candidatus Gastranaerophilales bacterium]
MSCPPGVCYTCNQPTNIIGIDKNNNINYESRSDNNKHTYEIFDFDSNGATDYERRWYNGEICEEHFFNNDPKNNEEYATTLNETTFCRSSGHSFFEKFLSILSFGLFDPHKNCENDIQEAREQADNFETTKYTINPISE